MINVAVIGFGFMGITHTLNIQQNKKINLCAIITRNGDEIPGRLAQQMGNFSGGAVDRDAILQVPTYKSLRECLKHQKVDAVQICVHTDMHYALAREAMELGLHVFLEKPISLRTEEAMMLINCARQQNVKFMVGHVVRFMPPYKKLKHWIQSGEFGKLEFISLTRFSGLPSWGQWKEKQEAFGSSGGALFDLIIHDIDYLQDVLGTPGKIQAKCRPGTLSPHDYIVANWYYPDVEAKIEGGNIFHATFPFQAGYMARFQQASVVYSSLKPEFIQVCSNEWVSSVEAGDANNGFYDEIDYFASCIISDSEPSECTPESSLKTLQLCYDHM